MRASKLITISTVAVLMGGTSLAIGHSLQSGESQSRVSTQGPASISQGNARGSEMKGSNAQASENRMRRGELSRERSSKLQSSRSQAISGARGQATMSERNLGTAGQEARTAAQIQGQPGSHGRRSFESTGGPVYGSASPGEARIGMTAEQRSRLHEFVMARRELPRVSHLPELRVNAVVPRTVRRAPVPEEIARHFPRFRGNEAFVYRNEIVLVDPATSRIVAVLPA
jgi:hypothetical protein